MKLLIFLSGLMYVVATIRAAKKRNDAALCGWLCAAIMAIGWLISLS